MYHSLLLCAHKFSTAIKALSRIPTVIKILVTQYCIFMGWILFRVSDIGDIRYCITQWVFIDWGTLVNGFSKYSDIMQLNAVFVGVPLVIVVLVYRKHLTVSNLRSVVEFDINGYIARVEKRVLVSLSYHNDPDDVLPCTEPSPEFIYFQF